MNFVRFFLSLVFFSATSLANLAELVGKKHETLVLLHVLFRHGDRTPDKASLFPNDLYTEATYEPFGYSQLTTKGKKTEYSIGKYLRRTYADFIPEQYSPDVVYALSTNVKRTKMSLQLVLASLFPPLWGETFELGLGWQPVPFNIEQGGNLISVASGYCPNYISKYYSYVLSDEAQKILAVYTDLYAKLSRYSGMDIITPKDAANIYFTLKCEEDFGLKLPQWASEVYPQVLEDASAVDYELSTATPDLKKLSAGFLLRKIIQDSLAKQNGTLPEKRKIFLYSAHEWNVATMLRTLGVFYRHVPPFGATVFFEIHNIDGEFGLKLYYQDYKQTNPKLLVIPGCTSFCPLDELIKLMGDNLPAEDDVCSTTEELM
ncbi:venom acid phosphatase Acph-1 [Tribolium castaneum]|uniref:acid phosphatase n=1 Tax=Tribolium castaneum TaxID=7070 RepID=D6WC84_TRICA|nr:PREDICTED: venom acid phosphatase Acph-1 [Tribolium castaneum]EEZ98776.1 Venom acid phosphatase Acph-1-like Protein [Tribolium castaneum]|eukprot:XP_972744.1 PREDICTED: venom acid phosphatase Acph-1 [Tribolium castaneum]